MERCNLRGLSKLVKWSKKSVFSSNKNQSILRIGYYGAKDPKAIIVAGVHGDEGPWGAWAINKLLNRIKKEEVIGSLVIVPQANPSAMEANSRVSPFDHLDLNRVFPGDKKGSYTQRVAHLISEIVMGGGKALIDLHGGGSWCVNAFAFKFKDSETLSEAFNPPFILDSPRKNGTLTNYANNIGFKVAAVEMGGRCEYEDYWAEYIASGLERCLISEGILEKEITDFTKQTVEVEQSKVLRPSSKGLFIPELTASSVGKLVKKGTILGKVVDPVTMTTLEEFKAPFNETAMMLLRPRMTIIEGGAMTYVISKPIQLQQV
jgi:predicted deacylase